MPRADDLVSRVRAALAGVPDVAEKRMFGGHAFMVRGKMCVTARAERIMVRVDPALHDSLVTRKGARTTVMGGREYRGYIQVEAEAVSTKRALQSWVDVALRHNEAIAADSKSGRTATDRSPPH